MRFQAIAEWDHDTCAWYIDIRGNFSIIVKPGSEHYKRIAAVVKGNQSITKVYLDMIVIESNEAFQFGIVNVAVSKDTTHIITTKKPISRGSSNPALLPQLSLTV
jgi:hypothetical protein